MRHASTPITKGLLTLAMTLLATGRPLVFPPSPARVSRVAELSATAAAVPLSAIVPRADAPRALTLEAPKLDEIDGMRGRHPQWRGGSSGRASVSPASTPVRFALAERPGASPN